MKNKNGLFSKKVLDEEHENARFTAEDKNYINNLKKQQQKLEKEMLEKIERAEKKVLKLEKEESINNSTSLFDNEKANMENPKKLSFFSKLFSNNNSLKKAQKTQRQELKRLEQIEIKKQKLQDRENRKLAIRLEKEKRDKESLSIMNENKKKLKENKKSLFFGNLFSNKKDYNLNETAINNNIVVDKIKDAEKKENILTNSQFEIGKYSKELINGKEQFKVETIGDYQNNKTEILDIGDIKKAFDENKANTEKKVIINNQNEKQLQLQKKQQIEQTKEMLRKEAIEAKNRAIKIREQNKNQEKEKRKALKEEKRRLRELEKEKLIQLREQKIAEKKEKALQLKMQKDEQRKQKLLEKEAMKKAKANDLAVLSKKGVQEEKRLEKERLKQEKKEKQEIIRKAKEEKRKEELKIQFEQKALEQKEKEERKILILNKQKEKQKKLDKEKKQAREERREKARLIRKAQEESRLKAKKERKNLETRLKEWYNNLSFVRDQRNRREMKRQTLLIDFEGADSVRSEEKIMYKYVAKNIETGKVETGYFSAFSKLDVHSFLIAEGYEVYEITPQKKYSISFRIMSSRFKSDELDFFLTQLSTFLKSGITLIDSVKILSKQSKSKTHAHVYKAIIYELTLGENFSEALSKQGNVFPRLLINMIKTSELTGDLPETLDDMANYYKETEQVKKQMISAITYPLVVLIFAIGILVFIMIGVIPKFVSIYQNLGTDLPGITVAVINLSNFLKYNWMYLLIGIIIFIVIFVILFKNIKVFKTVIQSLLMNVPVIGKIIIYNEVTMFTKTFASLLNHNVYITDCMEVLSKVTNNEVYKMLIFDTITNLAKGDAISNSFKNHWAFPNVAYEMILTGEKTGQLGTMMDKVAIYYQELHKNAVNQIKAFIEPVMIVILAVIVGVVLLSVVLPMFDMYQNIG